jgi:REP element-mobilizing transposase RayT
MAHTHTCLLYHLVFSTKGRRPFIDVQTLPRVAQFMGGIVRERDGKLLAMNGTENHVHLLASLPPKISISDQVGDIKSLSSGWIKRAFPGVRFFTWQEGFAGFTLGKSSVESVARYIAGQQKHHKKKTFEEELVEMYERADIDYDPKYIFD